MEKIDRRKHNNAAHLRKVEDQKKRPITFYELGKDIELLGGIEVVRAAMHDHFQKLIKLQNEFKIIIVP